MHTLTVTTRNSTYALVIGAWATTLFCLRGTFAGQQWNSSPEILLPGASGGVPFSLIPAYQALREGDSAKANALVEGLVGDHLGFRMLGVADGDKPIIGTSTVQEVAFA